MENLPNYIAIVFGLTTLATLILFYVAIKKSIFGAKANIIALGMLCWLAIQMTLGINLFYVNTVGNTPPPFPFFGFIPVFVFMIILFNTTKGKGFIDSLPLYNLTIISVVRIPVEIVLFLLFAHNTLPEILTFEGFNFDIIAGVTAPVIAYLGYRKDVFNKKILFAWNVICLLLLVTIVTMALLSFPTVFQQLSLDQPLLVMLHSPFIWLPSFIVPIVFFTHFVSIRQLTR